jgi:hypothetical protein
MNEEFEGINSKLMYLVGWWFLEIDMYVIA